MCLTGEKIRIRAFESRDFDGYYKMVNDPVIQETNGLLIPIGKEIAEQQFKDQMKMVGDDNYSFAIESFDGKCVGAISLLNIYWIERRGNTGVVIWDKAEWGKGYATDALRVLLGFAFEELNLHRICLHNGVYEFNKPAIRVYEKCGFVREGIRRKEYFHKGRWWDVIDMAIIEEEYFCQKSLDT